MHCNTKHKTRNAPIGEVEHGIALCRCRSRKGFVIHDDGPHRAKAGGAQGRLIGEFQSQARIANAFLRVISRG